MSSLFTDLGLIKFQNHFHHSDSRNPVYFAKHARNLKGLITALQLTPPARVHRTVPLQLAINTIRGRDTRHSAAVSSYAPFIDPYPYPLGHILGIRETSVGLFREMYSMVRSQPNT